MGKDRFVRWLGSAMAGASPRLVPDRRRGGGRSRAGVIVGAVCLAGVVLTAIAPLAGARPVSGSTIYTIAGNGTFCRIAPTCGDGGAATSAQLSFPEGVAVDSAGNVYVADTNDSELRKVSPSGRITRFAGNGAGCTTAPACADRRAATRAQITAPYGVAVDSEGNVYVADFDGQEVHKISPAGRITRIAGNGRRCRSAPFGCGDGGAATSAELNRPDAVAVDASGNVYVADYGDSEVREVSPGGEINRIAGTGHPCLTAPACGDGRAATSAELNNPGGVAVDSAGNVYVADTNDSELRKVSPSGEITRFAGTGNQCLTASACGDGRAATSAELNLPKGVAVDAAGNVYVGDTEHLEVRKISPRGEITRFAGNGLHCRIAPACGDGRPATSAQLSDPNGVAVDAAGNVYVVDTSDQVVRCVAHAGRLVLTAPRAKVDHSHVSVRYMLRLTGAAKIVLSVDAGPGPPIDDLGPPIVVARARGHRGVNRIAWNRRLHGRKAGHGSYELIVTATVRRRSVSSVLTIRL